MGRDWKRLAAYVVARRVEIGYPKRAAWANSLVGKVTDRTLGNLETGKSVSADTLAIVEHSLGWAPGSCERILMGSLPALLEASPVVRSSTAEQEVERHLREALRLAGSREDFLQRVLTISSEPTPSAPTPERDRSSGIG